MQFEKSSLVCLKIGQNLLLENTTNISEILFITEFIRIRHFRSF